MCLSENSKNPSNYFSPAFANYPHAPFSISSRTVFSRPSALPLHTPPFFLSTKEGTIAPQNENTEGFLTVAAAFPANISHDTQRKEDKRGEEATFYLILRTLGGGTRQGRGNVAAYRKAGIRHAGRAGSPLRRSEFLAGDRRHRGPESGGAGRGNHFPKESSM